MRSHCASRDYLSAEAIVSEYQEVQGWGSDCHRTYYRLTYAYTVDGETYYITDGLLVYTLPPAG